MLKITIPVLVYGSQSWLTKATIEGAPEAFRSTVVWLPVERIVNVGKYVKQVDRIEFSETVPNSVHTGEYQVEAET